MNDWARHFIGWTTYLRRHGIRGPFLAFGTDIKDFCGWIWNPAADNDNARG